MAVMRTRTRRGWVIPRYGDTTTSTDQRSSTNRNECEAVHSSSPSS